MANSTDPIDLLLDSSGDFVVGTDLTWSTGLAAVAQAARIAVQAVRGDWFLDPDEGIPLWERDNVTAQQAILGQKFDQLKATAAYRAALETVDDATITNLTISVDRPSRTLNVTWSLTTVFGDTNPDTLIIPTGAS